MESLIELVAASFSRHGIECRDGVSNRPSGVDPAWKVANSPRQASTQPPAQPTALPEHNYRKILDGDPAP